MDALSEVSGRAQRKGFLSDTVTAIIRNHTAASAHQSAATRIPRACSRRTGLPPQPCRIAHSRIERCSPMTCQTQLPAGLRCPRAAQVVFLRKLGAAQYGGLLSPVGPRHERRFGGTGNRTRPASALARFEERSPDGASNRDDIIGSSTPTHWTQGHVCAGAPSGAIIRIRTAGEKRK